jgi:hypothetical protein
MWAREPVSSGRIVPVLRRLASSQARLTMRWPCQTPLLRASSPSLSIEASDKRKWPPASVMPAPASAQRALRIPRGSNRACRAKAGSGWPEARATISPSTTTPAVQ